jgi:hypothetical protein
VAGFWSFVNKKMNVWLKFNRARKIAKELQHKYFNLDYYCQDEELLEFKILEDLWSHPLYTDDMLLNIIWDDYDRLLWLQVGLNGIDSGLVPR